MSSKLKIKRVEKGLSQERLSEISNVSRPYISNLENEKQTPSYSIAFKLAQALDTTSDELFGDIFLAKLYSNKYGKGEENDSNNER